MLSEMQMKSINESESSELSSDSIEKIQKPIVDKDTYRTIVEQKQILNDYCTQIQEIHSKKHRNYWNQIKRVHGRLAEQLENQEKFEKMIKAATMEKEKENRKLTIEQQNRAKLARIAAYKKSKRMNKLRGEDL